MFPTTLTTPRASFAVPPGVTSPPRPGCSDSCLLPTLTRHGSRVASISELPFESGLFPLLLASSFTTRTFQPPQSTLLAPWCPNDKTQTLIFGLFQIRPLSQQTLGGYGLAPGVTPRTPFSSLSERLRIRPDTKAPLETRGFQRPSLSSCKACSVFSASRAPTHLRTHLNITSP